MSLNKNGELLTLQFGHHSNFVGSHWWNIQERSFEYSKCQDNQDINHEVLYREGLNHKGQVTFTPRLLLVDLKGSLGAFPEKSDLYEDAIDPSDINVEWYSDKVEILNKEEKLKKNKFQEDLDNDVNVNENTQKYDFENEVTVWSDFLYTRFHPRTINIVKEYQHESNSSLDIFPIGVELWKSEQFEEEFSNKIRSYIEECDYFQGVQVLLDAVDGFSGLSTSCIEHLKDEYGRSIVSFPIIPSYYSDYNYKTDEERHKSLIKDSNRVLNLAFTFNALKENSNLFVPLCTSKDGWRKPGEQRQFYHSNYNAQLNYHSSAILASALDTFSLKYRMKSSFYTLSDLSTDLTSYGRIAAAASLCLPFSLNLDAELIDCLDNWSGPLTQSITPNCNLGSDRMVQLYTMRGLAENRLKKSSAKAGSQKKLPAYKCETIREMLEFYLSCTTYASINNVTVVSNPLPVMQPFPKLFDDSVGYNGNIIASSRPPSIDVHSIPVMAGLHNGSEVGKMLESLHTETKKIKFGKFHNFKNGGLEMDDYVECLDNLFSFRESYEDNYFV